METKEEQQRQREAYVTGLKRGQLLYETLGEMAEENHQTVERWIASFDTVWQDAFLVLVPSLCGFVIWVLKRALEEGKKRLYFVARDGYLMYRLAEILCQTLGLPIECRYLYCSRYALRIPAFHLDMEGALDFICRGGIDVTMEKILNRSGIGGKDRRKVLRMLRLPYAGDEVMPYAKLKDVKRRLAECEYFLGCVERNSRQRMPELAGYLRQEGVLDGNDYALVDSGWTGSMQKTLGEVLAHLGRRESLKGYYFGLYELPKGVERDDYEAYYFGPKGCLSAKVYFSNCLFESVFSAPHGMTVGYRECRGEYVPFLAECFEERCRFARRMELCVMVYGEKLANNIKMRARWQEGARAGDKDELREAFLGLDVHEFRDMTRRLFKTFMGRPTKAEAEAFGDLKFSDDVLEDTLYKTAAKLTEEELAKNHVWNKALVMLGVRKGSVKESAWYEGSVARVGKHNKRHWRMYAAYKYLLYARQAGRKR